MKFQLLRASFSIVLAAGSAVTSTISRAEAHCPGNASGFHARLVAGALLTIPVKINEAGPFDFIVDTGSQLNVIDSALAAELGLRSQARVGLATASSVLQASVVIPDSLETGSLRVLKPLVAVENLGPYQAADPRIRGVLGENFLAHFDVLMDYRSRLVCLDQTGAMQEGLRGERVPLVRPKDQENQIPFTGRLVISVNLSDTGDQEILLQLDSGSDGPILYSANPRLQETLLRRARLQGPEVGEARRAFAVLPPQDMRLGSRVVRKVPFVTPVRAAQSVPDRGEDGILATVLFQRVYISHSEHFAIFDPK